jgi:CheY-like chemotaxis protein
MNVRADARKPVVLLVEDHADSRQMYAEYLRFEFEVFEAGDGIAALEMLERHPAQIIVTDLALPRMDGYEFIERVKGDPRFRDAAIIALSGFSSSDHTARAHQAGCDIVLQKPCLPDRLSEVVAAAAMGGGHQS